MKKPYSYNLFFDFIESYALNGFQNIGADDPILQRLEEIMEENEQFFSVSDMSRMKYLFTSKGCLKMLGVEPAELNPGFFMHAIHPDDLQRLALGRVKMMKVVNEIYSANAGSMLMSFTLRLLTPAGDYMPFLGQAYIFHSNFPHKAVYNIQVVTNVDWCKKINPDGHYMICRDTSLFKFPDEELLQIGSNLSDREFEVVKLVAQGMGSNEIAGKISVSVNTVNTHRHNILKKTDKATIADLIIDLKNLGLL